jgi:hypothetical protein
MWKRALWLCMFPWMLLVINPLQEITTSIREWWETFDG